MALPMQVLYKYVTAERALRATQPSALNDPFECAVVSGFVVRDELDGVRIFSDAPRSNRQRFVPIWMEPESSLTIAHGVLAYRA